MFLISEWEEVACLPDAVWRFSRWKQRFHSTGTKLLEARPVCLEGFGKWDLGVKLSVGFCSGKLPQFLCDDEMEDLQWNLDKLSCDGFTSSLLG